MTTTTLEYIKSNKTVVFISNITQVTGVTIDLTGEKQFPQYHSWMGFEGWIETIMDELGMTRNQAWVALLEPTQDCDWVFELAEKALAQIAGAVTPFNKYRGSYTPVRAQVWARSWRHIVSFKEFLLHGEIIKTVGVRNREEFLVARTLPESAPRENLKLFRAVKGFERPANERILFAINGRITPMDTALFDKITGGVNIGECMEDGYFHVEGYARTAMELSAYTDISRLNSISVKDFMRAGVPTKILIKGNYTRKQKRFLANAMEDYAPMDLWDRLSQLVINTYLRKYTSLPEAWWCEVDYKEIGDWADRHIEKLSEFRIIHGPGGEVQTMHYHRLLSRMTPDILTNGPKTAWRRVIAGLEAIAQREIEAELGKDVALPTLKHKTISKVEKIGQSKRLREEGEEMKHCVGGYVKACLAQKSFIYHVGDPVPGGATVEICKKGGKHIAQQIFGFKDRAATSYEHLLAAQLIAELDK